MTNDYAIQPQVVQERKNPYLTGGIGAAVGAGAGWAASAMYNKSGEAKSYEDLVKEATGNDKVELTSKKEALEKAEKELETAGKAVYEGTEKEALETAIKNRDAELARLTETKTGSKVFDAKKWDKLGIEANELPTVNERTGKSFTTNKGAAQWEAEVRAEYDRLKREYDKAIKGLGDKELIEQNKIELEIQKYLDASNNRNKSTRASKLDRIFSTEATNMWGKPAGEYAQATRVAQTVHPQISNLSAITDEQFLSFAERLEKGASVPSGYTRKTVYEVVEGKRQAVNLIYTKDMLNEFVKSENAKIAEQQKTLVESLLSRARENVDLQKRFANFDKNFIEATTDATAQRTGLYKTLPSGRKEINIAGIMAEAGKQKAGFYQSDINKLEKLIEKEGGASTKLPKKLKGTYTGATDLQALYDMAVARRDVLKDYNAELKALNTDIRACRTDHAIIKELEEKIASIRNTEPKVLEAKEAIIRQFPGLAEGAEKVGLSQAEAMEKDSYKKLAKIVEDKQAIYDKLASEKGKVNETAKKAAEEAKNKAKTELEELVNKLNGNVKGMNGKVKAAVIGALAVVGGLIGASIANSKNKAAEAAEKQIIA